MAETKLINFRYGMYDEINGLGKDANCIYFASDKPLFYAVGKWHGIASMVSEVDRVNSKTILKINGDGGYAINCEIEGETLSNDLKEKLINAYEFVQLISGEDEDVIINKWNEIVAFLQGFGEADKLLNVVVELQNNLADEVANRISADQKHTEDIKSITDLVNDMFTLVDKGDGTKYIQSKYGFASDSFISARGVDEESSGVGGLDAQAVWDLLMQNDDATKIINVAHIPDITIAKITDIANASVANADTLDGKHLSDISQEIDAKSNGLDLNTMLSDSALLRTTWDFAHSDKVLNQPWSESAANAWLLPGNYPLQIARDFYSNDIRVRGHSHYGWTAWKQIAFRETTLSGYGITDAVTLNTDQTITGVKTFSNLRVNNSTMIANLNAEMVGGVSSNKLMRYLIRDTYLSAQLIGEESKKAAETFIEYWGTGGYYNSKWGSVEAINGFKGNLTGNAATATWADKLDGLHKDDFQQAVYTYSPLPQGNDIANTTALANIIAPNITSDSDNFKFYDTKFYGTASSTSNRAQIAYGYKYDGIHFRRYYNGAWTNWKQLAFTDTNSLTPSGGTLTINGNLTVANQLTIGNATLYWDVANQCLRVNAGIASDSFLSAKGIDTTGNGQGGGGGLDATMLWNELTIPSPTNSGKVISSQFLPVQEILTPVASDISEINAEIIALQDRIANIEQALTWQGVS